MNTAITQTPPANQKWLGVFEDNFFIYTELRKYANILLMGSRRDITEFKTLPYWDSITAGYIKEFVKLGGPRYVPTDREFWEFLIRKMNDTIPRDDMMYDKIHQIDYLFRSYVNEDYEFHSYGIDELIPTNVKYYKYTGHNGPNGKQNISKKYLKAVFKRLKEYLDQKFLIFRRGAENSYIIRH